MALCSHPLFVACLAAGALFSSPLALAQVQSQAQSGPAWPSKPIKLVVPFPPGGAADLTARLVGQKMGEALGQPVVVDNRPGANGLVGTEAVARSAPDGYTLLLVDRGALGINPSLYAKLPYDPLKDFAYIGVATTAPYVLVANPSLPAKSVAELVALAKAKPRSINYASFGVGSMPQMNFEALNHHFGIELQHVPYKGAAAAVTAVVSGEVGVALVSAPSALGFLRDGRLRALAVGADRRLELLPEVPTLTQAGGSSDTLVPTYFAMAAPAGTPRPVIERLNLELGRALALPDVAAKLGANGLLAQGGSPDAVLGTVTRDVAYFGALAKVVGLKPE